MVADDDPVRAAIEELANALAAALPLLTTLERDCTALRAAIERAAQALRRLQPMRDN